MDFEGLYSQYWTGIIRYIQYKFPSLSREDCEDLAQNSFIRAWQQMAEFDPAKGSEIAWLCNFAHWQGKTALRSPNGRVYVEYDSELDGRVELDVARVVEARDTLAMVEIHMSRHQGQEILLAFAQEVEYLSKRVAAGTYEGMAEALGIRPMQAKKRMDYLKKTLKQEMK